MAARSLTLSKAEAATRQVEAAIRAYRIGDFDISITLAGAAEGMFSDRTGRDFISVSTKRVLEKGIDKSDWITALNLERNWLKHTTPNVQGPMSFGAPEAALMLVRAMSKLDAWTPAMDSIKPDLIKLLAADEPFGPATEVVKMMDTAIEEHEGKAHGRET